MSVEIQGPDAARAEESALALDRDILDSLTTLVKRAGTIGQSIAAGFGVAPHDLLALFKLDEALTMKELARHMGCDASFVTTIADTLERHGFARREPGQRDRRVKNLVLTSEGITAKERMMAQLAAKMPWCYALDDGERRCLLFLLRKMLNAPSPGTADATVAGDQSVTDHHNQSVPGPHGEVRGADDM
jgi:DNA-binding MarR family transcriptional regulator